MLKFNHLNMTVCDVTGPADFFERCFDFKFTERRGNGKFAILEGSDGKSRNRAVQSVRSPDFNKGEGKSLSVLPWLAFNGPILDWLLSQRVGGPRLRLRLSFWPAFARYPLRLPSRVRRLERGSCCPARTESGCTFHPPRRRWS